MDKLRAMATFVRIVDRGSLTAAANDLGVSLPSVVRTLAALESALGVRLLNRTTRRLSMTDEGREYAARCRRVLAEVDEAEAALSARRAKPRGRLHLTAPVLFGRMHVAPLVTAFALRHPGLQVDVTLLDRPVDLVEEGIDLALRIGVLRDSSLVAVPLGETRRVVCASPAYLRRHGTPRTIADLAKHRCVTFSGIAAHGEWTFAADTRAAVGSALTTNQVDVAIDACVAGLGPTQLLSYQVQRLLDDGRLRRLLVDHEPAPAPIHVVYPSARLLSTNVRAFLDWAVPRLRAARYG